VPADNSSMPSSRRLRRTLRRPLLAAVAIVVVALGATACLPAAAPTAPKAAINRCPVDGFEYIQGFSSTHGGVDMAAPLGAPVYAVRSGTLWYWSTGDVGGYSLYLKADDGNTYYYTHLTPYPAAWENSTRPVKAGDVIELVNHTGNAKVDHLHFEVRLGGPNGAKVDPRPTLDAAGCASQ
jgi:murein DD-endopeptidase MepM/ murein hydrolase activator NlpD